MTGINPYRGALGKFWAFLDSESVRLYQVVMYSCFLWAGLYIGFHSRPPSTVRNQMGVWVEHTWVAMLIVCPILVFIGAKVRDKYTGYWLQLAGDLGMTVSLVAFITSAFESPLYGTGLFGVWSHIGLALCTTALTVRDVRQIVLSEKVHHMIEADRAKGLS